MYGLRHLIASFGLVLRVSIHSKSRLKNEDLQAGEVDDRIPVLHLARSRTKKQSKNETEIRYAPHSDLSRQKPKDRVSKNTS